MEFDGTPENKLAACFTTRCKSIENKDTDIRWVSGDEAQKVRIENGRHGLDNEIKTVYDSMPHLTDDEFVKEILPELKEKYGVL